MQSDLFLVRHGETAWNAESRFQGQQDSPLTPLGVAQAAAAATYLASRGLSALYSSDLPRTLKTAQPIAVATRLAVMPEAALRERNLGIFEGLTRSEVELRHAEAYQHYLARKAEFVIPNGESLQQLEQRAMQIMARLAQRHLGERIAVVSHGAFLTTFLRRLRGIPLHLQGEFTLENGTISHVRFDEANGEWTIMSLGEIIHSVTTQ